MKWLEVKARVRAERPVGGYDSCAQKRPCDQGWGGRSETGIETRAEVERQPLVTDSWGNKGGREPKIPSR